MLIFTNNGEIDVRSIKTFGVSSKESTNAVGFFGTGLKYAIAIMLRTGHKVTIHSGEQVLEFGLERHTVRVDEFDVVTMNGEPLAFTTELGKTWELWQAYRELHCNCTDEGGKVKTLSRAPRPKAGQTHVVVVGPEIEELHRSNNVLLRSKPLAVLPGVEIHPGQGHLMYYQGIRAYSMMKPALFTYNLTSKQELTEDRSLKNSVMAGYQIAKEVMSYLTDEAILDKILTAHETLEEGWDFNWPSYPTSILFVDRVVALHREFKPVNRSAVRQCDHHILTNTARTQPKELDSLDAKRLGKAIDFCASLGYQVSDYPIVVSSHLGEGVLGRAADNTIFLADRVFMQGTKQVAATLLEEYLHLKHGLIDETYQMQTFLFDVIMSLGERVTGEVL